MAQNALAVTSLDRVSVRRYRSVEPPLSGPKWHNGHMHRTPERASSRSDHSTGEGRHGQPGWAPEGCRASNEIAN